jgi:hypothetical protein
VTRDVNVITSNGGIRSRTWETNEATGFHHFARWCGWRVDLRRYFCRAEIADSSDWNP